MNFNVAIREMHSWIPWELIAVTWGSAEQTVRSTVFGGKEGLKISNLTNKIVEKIYKMFDVQVTVHHDKFL